MKSISIAIFAMLLASTSATGQESDSDGSVPTQLNEKQKQLLRDYAAAGSQEAHGHNGRSWFGRIVDAILG